MHEELLSAIEAQDILARYNLSPILSPQLQFIVTLGEWGRFAWNTEDISLDDYEDKYDAS